MALLLLFFFISGTFNYVFQNKKSISLAFTYTSLFFAISTFIITECSSFFNYYNFYSSVLFWSILSACILILNIKKKYLNTITYLHWLKSNKKISLFLVSFSVVLFFQGLKYPPNNWDSMTYHMARIAHWVMNENIYPYPTHVYRQIYQPPLAEWMVSQICILNKADYFANSLQLFFLLASLAVTNLIMRFLQLEKKIRITACILLFTTPSILMQATATQNDIVVGFFLLSSIYSLVLFFKEKTLLHAILIGVSIGCALLTKGTAFIYLMPIALLGVILLVKDIYTKCFNRTKHSLFILLIISLSITLPFSHFYRNYKLSNDIFGASEDHYFNEHSTLQSTFVGIIKNVGNHLSTPLTASVTNQVVEKLHLVSKIPINDKNYSYNGIQFKLNNWNHNEDEVSNFFQIILFACVLLFVLISFKKIDKTLFITGVYCLLTFLLFSLLLKWQPWHIRLQVPLFMMIAIPSAILIHKILSRKLVIAYLSTITCYCILLILLNPNRPFITNKKQASLNTRFEKYFVAMPLFLPEFKKWRYRIEQNIPTKWDVHGDTWEYPLYYDCFDVKRNEFKNVNVKNQSKYAVSKK